MATITLSNRQAKEADRIGGIELMIAWPAELGPAPEIEINESREATIPERRLAEQMVRDSCAARKLVPVHVRVTHIHGPNHEPPAVYLAVTIIGHRWVHASTQRRGKIMFAAGGRDGLHG